MKRTALKIGYVGTNFHGFQRQPDLRTVEEELIYHLKKLGYIDDLKEARFRIAGRTDAGVHSLGNVISFQSEKEVLINQINHSLPDDIQILGSAPVRYGFKPRYAKMRHYRYILIDYDLDFDLLLEVAEAFKGTYNFTNFTKRNQKTTTRTISDIKITKPEISKDNNNFPHLNSTYDPIFVDIYGESFLWNMVRKMMRVFVDFSQGKLSLDQVQKYLNPKKDAPREHIKVLDPEYLILMDIEYENINFTPDDYAGRRFKKYLVNELLTFQKEYAITECFMKSFDDLKYND